MREILFNEFYMLRSSLTLIAVTISGLLHAAPNENSENIERVIITGSRVIENIDEVPASITIISQADIQEQLKITPELQNMLAQLVPGMAPSTGTASNASQTLRGRAALIMIDGVPQSTPLRNGSLGIKSLDPSAIERIEVIKGATSIYGNGAAGGIINYITKKAASDKKLAGSASISSRFSAVKFEDTLGLRYNASVNGQQNNLSYVLSASYEENGLQRDAQGDVPGLMYGLSDSETENIFAKLGYQIDNDKSVQFTYNFYKSQQQSDLIDVTGSVNSGEKTYAVKAPANTDIKGVPQGPRGNHNFMMKYTDLALLDNTQLTVDLYKQTIENVFFFSAALANQSEGFDGGQSLIKSDKSGLRLTANSQFDFENVESTLIYGIDTLNDVTSQPLVDGRIWVPEMDMENIAGFLQTKWVVADDVVLKAGLRKESINLAVDDYQTLKLCREINQCSVAMDVKGDTLHYSATTYNIAAKYNAYPQFSPFISFSQGADISDTGRLLRAATVNDIADIQTEASIIDNYELGFTSEFDDLRFEVAAYRSTSELGTTNKFNAATGVYEPVRAPQKIWGYEALVQYQLNQSLAINATYSWIEGKNTAQDVYLGAQQISAPKATVNLRWQALENASLSINYLHVGNRKRFEKIEGEYVGDQGPIDNYQVVNLSGQMLFEHYKVFVGIENLFNQDYYSARSQSFTYKGYNTKSIGTTVNLGLSIDF